VVATELAQVVLAGTVTGGVGPFSYRWTKLDGPPCAVSGGTTAAASFQAPPVGPAGVDLTFGLEVTDLGVTTFTSTHYDTVTVHVVNSANAVPVANPGPARSVVAGEWTVLDGTASTDADQHPLTYLWTCTTPSSPAQNLGQYVPQGTSAAAQTPWRAPNVTSTTTFVFQLAVSDNEATGTATLSLTVTAPPPSFSGSATSMAPYRQELTAAEARHLLRRMGLGWHPSDVAATVAQSKTPGVGLSGIVDAALATPQIAAVADEAMNYAPQIASPTAGVPQFNQPFDPYPSLTTAQIEAHWLIHAFRSPAALRERTAQMLHGRLAASVRNLPDGKRHWSLLHADMLRHGVVVPGTSNLVAGTGPFGDWRTMLLHFARDPVTLSFIDGFDNLRFAPNENFAREFFELHALGILDENGVPIYGESDVKESARAFTGWRPVCYALNPAKPASCEPSFSLPFHDNGLKTILGSAPTNFDDQGVVDLALDYDGGDNAARRLARLLIGHFVTETPDPALVTQLKSTILANDWDLEPVLATLLKSEAMFSASARKAIVKSPLELALGATKTLRTPLQTRDIVTGSSMWSHLKLLQHRPGNPIDVNGWPRDVEWADDYMLVRRSELLRKIVLVSRTPTPPVGGATPDYPGVAATPVALSAFLPPPTARKSDETVRLLEEIFDVDLKETTGTGGSTSEFLAAKNLLDTLTIGSGGCPSNAPFDGDCPQHADRLWSLVMLFFEHPEFARL
ncbi:MAG TPA: DUF1800 family protein, partial [Planctomycetota bacterium]|nr:DUF1800 family protein [Planctomycetota bacterium]